MLALQCVCEDFPTLESYLKGSMIPRNVATDEPFSMPPHLTQLDPMNRFNERKMSPKDVLCSDTAFNWTPVTSRKSLRELAFEALKEDVLKGDGKSTLLLENMQGLLPASWFTSARTLIADISGPSSIDDKATLSLIVAAWEDLYGIYTKYGVRGVKKKSSKKLNASEIQALKASWAKADHLEVTDALLWLHADRLAEKWWIALKNDFRGFVIDATDHSEFYPCDIFDRVTAQRTKLKRKFLEEFGEKEFERKRSKSPPSI